MWFTLGSYRVRIDRWHSEAEKIQYLDNCGLGRLDLGTDLHPGALHFTVTVSDQANRLGIGIGMDNHGLSPGLLLDLERTNLIVGFDRTVAIVNVPARKVVSKHELDYTVFYRFHSLHHVGISDFFLAHHELGVKAIAYDGATVWDFTGADVLSSVTISQDEVAIGYLDLPDIVHLSLLTGKRI